MSCPVTGTQGMGGGGDKGLGRRTGSRRRHGGLSWDQEAGTVVESGP